MTKSRGLSYAVKILLLGSFVFAAFGYFQRESDLEDNERVNLFNSAFKDGYIAISQPSSGQPLEPTTLAEFSELKQSDQKRFGKNRWERMRRQALRFIAAVNQGIGDPFEYRKDIPDRGVVERVKEGALRYQNPFEGEHTGPIITRINSSQKVAENRDGWRIVGKNLVLYLKPGGERRRVNPGVQFVFEVGGEFELLARGNSAVTLRIHTQGDGKLQSLVLERGGEGGRQSLIRQDGDYFVWDDRPFAVYRANNTIADAEDTSLGDLVFSKVVNGKSTRIQVLGRATASLIGSQVGGETGGIDGAFLHANGRRLVLTIDPEVQSAAYFALYSALRRLDSEHPSNLRRSRQGAVTVLDVNTGQILAHAGAPGYDPLWEAGRIILANRQQVVQNPANQLHMPGSAIKVLTGGMGYILFGEGSGEMLPTSINKLAIRQAFRNVYGGSMPPEIILTSDGEVIHPEGDNYFRDYGQSQRIQKDFLKILNSGFNVMDHKPPDEDALIGAESIRKDLYEQIAGDLGGYFDPLAKYDFLPLRSRFPAADADSMERFRQFAIGGNETRFTTLRLAATLGTVSTGQLFHPFIIESVFDPAVNTKDNRVSNSRANAFSDLRAVLPDIEGVQTGNDRRMIEQMTHYLEQVCVRGRGRTGFYFNGSNREIFMTEDDPATTDDEANSRQGDFGKTGTADNGSQDPFNDSIFVYRHGRYIVAVWMERAHGGAIQHPANGVVNQIVQSIEKLEQPHS